MKKETLLCSFILLMMACTPAKDIQKDGAAAEKQVKPIEKIYTPITIEADFVDFVDKNVQFQARVCNFEMQHMLVSSMGDSRSTYICMDRVDEKGKMINQLLAYTKERAAYLSQVSTFKNKRFSVFGKLKVASGAGKGGGTHKEYYLELDKIAEIEIPSEK